MEGRMTAKALLLSKYLRSFNISHFIGYELDSWTVDRDLMEVNIKYLKFEHPDKSNELGGLIYKDEL